MSNLAGTVKQIAVSAEEKTVFIELICAGNYEAQVLADDITSRLQTDQVLSLIVKVAAKVAS